MCIDYLGRVPAASPVGACVYIMFCHLLFCDCALELEPVSGIDGFGLAITLIKHRSCIGQIAESEVENSDTSVLNNAS